MRVAHLLTAIGAAIITQGNIVSALPSDAFDKEDGYIGGKHTSDEIEARTVTLGDEIEVAHFDLEKRATQIFPEFPIGTNDLLWVGLLTGCGIFVYRNGKVVWEKIPQEWKDSTYNCIANAFNAAMAKMRRTRRVNAEEVHQDAQRIGGGIHRGAQAVQPLAQGMGVPVGNGK